jgi:hypothetical protein
MDCGQRRREMKTFIIEAVPSKLPFTTAWAITANDLETASGFVVSKCINTRIKDLTVKRVTSEKIEISFIDGNGNPATYSIRENSDFYGT